MTSRRETLVRDTNPVVSAFLRPDGAAAQALRRALLGFDVAASLISGDKKDLLRMDPYQGIRILSPRQFLSE
ncbi:MAG: hypothetical protein QM674_24075 [Burkholderiaceae bacterium]